MVQKTAYIFYSLPGIPAKQVVKNALSRMNEVYSHLKPFEQRELMSLVLRSAQVNEKEIVLEIYALGEQAKVLKSVNSGEKVRQTPNWLPD
jgi:hypothetical protein